MISKLKYIIPVAVVILGLSSCKKEYLSINTDPNNPVEAPVPLLLTGAEKSLGDALSMGGGENGGLSQILEVYVHRITTREEADQYGATGNEFFLGLAWPKLYSSTPPPGESEPLSGVLQNLEEIIKQASQEGNPQYRGIAKVLKAYAYSQLVDAFADVPFSEANKLADSVAPVIYPKFDNGQDIYPQLFTLLDEGIADLSSDDGDNLLTPSADDVIYGGNTANWIKAANTIKLKLYTQLRLVQDVSAEVTALLADPESLINSPAESFMLPYGTLGATDSRNPAFQEYFSTQRSNHISPWFYETMKGRHSNVLFNNPDPRIPYYFYNQLRRRSTDPAIPYEGENPDNQTEYRDDAFASIYFGSVGPDRDRNNQNTLTTLGIYPAGGRYDNGGGGQLGSWEDVLRPLAEDPDNDEKRPADGDGVDGPHGTGAAPYRFLTYADRLYLEAELINAGDAPGDARAVFEAAVTASFEQVDQVAGMAGVVSQALPKIMVDFATEVETYIDKVMDEYDAGNDTKKLELIMTEKWIQSFGNAVDAYTDYRRTGFPVFWDPSNPAMAPGGNAQPPVNGDPLQAAQKAVPVLISRQYPQSLPWPTTELETNVNAPVTQKDPATYKVFWKP
jgi:hypothetical protein